MPRLDLIQVRVGTQASLDALPSNDKPLLGEIVATVDTKKLYLGMGASVAPVAIGGTFDPEARNITIGVSDNVDDITIGSGTYTSHVNIYARSGLNMADAGITIGVDGKCGMRCYIDAGVAITALGDFGGSPGDQRVYVFGCTLSLENAVFKTDVNTPVGFFGATPVYKPTGVAVTAEGIHAALVSLGLISA